MSYGITLTFNSTGPNDGERPVLTTFGDEKFPNEWSGNSGELVLALHMALADLVGKA